MADVKGVYMSYSPKEQKAIAWHMTSHNCIVQLSVRPKMRFLTKGEVEHHEENLNSLVSSYEVWKSDDQRARAKERANAKRAEKLRAPYKETNY